VLGAIQEEEEPDESQSPVERIAFSSRGNSPEFGKAASESPPFREPETTAVEVDTATGLPEGTQQGHGAGADDGAGTPSKVRPIPGAMMEQKGLAAGKHCQGLELEPEALSRLQQKVMSILAGEAPISDLELESVAMAEHEEPAWQPAAVVTRRGGDPVGSPGRARETASMSGPGFGGAVSSRCSPALEAASLEREKRLLELDRQRLEEKLRVSERRRRLLQRQNQALKTKLRAGSPAPSPPRSAKRTGPEVVELSGVRTPVAQPPELPQEEEEEEMQLGVKTENEAMRMEGLWRQWDCEEVPSAPGARTEPSSPKSAPRAPPASPSRVLRCSSSTGSLGVFWPLGPAPTAGAPPPRPSSRSLPCWQVGAPRRGSESPGSNCSSRGSSVASMSSDAGGPSRQPRRVASPQNRRLVRSPSSPGRAPAERSSGSRGISGGKSGGSCASNWSSGSAAAGAKGNPRAGVRGSASEQRALAEETSGPSSDDAAGKAAASGEAAPRMTRIGSARGLVWPSAGSVVTQSPAASSEAAQKMEPPAPPAPGSRSVGAHAPAATVRGSAAQCTLTQRQRPRAAVQAASPGVGATACSSLRGSSSRGASPARSSCKASRVLTGAFH